MADKNAKELLRNFYDTYGWRVDPHTGRYLGQILHEDSDSLTQTYMDEGELRHRKYFEEDGDYFLDAGCGAKPRTRMARGFRRHVCVDVSIVGLRECKRKVGQFGHYVLADIAFLPFAKGVFDGTLASHILYHIDKDLQQKVVKELYRVTKPEKTVLIFYNSVHNLLSITQKAAKGVGLLLKSLAQLLRPNAEGGALEQSLSDPPPMYFYAHDPSWLAGGFNKVDVTCLSILTRHETRILGKLHLLKFVLPLVTALEVRFPHLMIRIGKYTSIRITVTS